MTELLASSLRLAGRNVFLKVEVAGSTSVIGSGSSCPTWDKLSRKELSDSFIFDIDCRIDVTVVGGFAIRTSPLPYREVFHL